MTSHKINNHSYFVCNHPISGPTYAEMQQNRRNLCQICGGVAKGIYYTATSCKSCMDFFRRCVIFDKRYKVVSVLTSHQLTQNCIIKVRRDFGEGQVHWEQWLLPMSTTMPLMPLSRVLQGTVFLFNVKLIEQAGMRNELVLCRQRAASETIAVEDPTIR